MSQAPPVDVERTAPETEISLGRSLRRAREVRGITIEQIARETKINERYLHALENDRLDLLPGQLYARNFVRSVARTIGADEEELLDYFNYQVRLQDDQEGGREDGRTGHASRRGPLLAVAIVGGILLVVVLTMALRPHPPKEASTPPRPQRTAAPPTTTLPAAVDQAAAPAPAGAAPADAPATAPSPATIARPVPPVLQPAAAATPAAGTAPADTSASAPAAALGPAPSLRVAFTDQSWVEIQREGDAEQVGLKQKGDTLTYALDRPVTLTILNSAGAAISVDGQPFRALGGPQEKRTITVDRKNFTQYLKK